jgi:hypothetical protein
MSYTVNQLALELIRAHGENSGDANYVLVVEQWIRDALDELGLETNWRIFQDVATLATVASTRVYKLPFNVRDINYIRDPATETDLVYYDKARLSMLNMDLENVSRPQFWYYEELALDTVPNPDEYVYQIGFHPIPDAIYNYDIGSQINPSGLLTSSIIPVVGDLLFALKAGVRAYMYIDDENPQMALLWRQMFTTNIAKLRIRDNNKINDKPVLQNRDLSNRTERRLARLDPNHFR